MADSQPPRPSPRLGILPEMPNEPKTDPAIRVIKRSMKKELNWQGAKLTIATAVIAVGTAFGAYRAVLSEAAAQTDAGVRVLAAEQKGLEARTTTLEKRFDRFEERTDKQMNAVLDALRVPQSKRPAPLDGGE